MNYLNDENYVQGFNDGRTECENEIRADLEKEIALLVDEHNYKENEILNLYEDKIRVLNGVILMKDEEILDLMENIIELRKENEKLQRSFKENS